MLVLKNDDIELLVEPIKMLKAVEDAFVAFESKGFNLPNRQHLTHEDTTHLLMPVASNDYYLCKNISIGKDPTGKATTNGCVMLSSGKDGEVLAVMNTEALTSHRTGAMAAVAAKHLYPDKKARIGIVGAGNIGRHIALYLSAAMKVNKFTVLDSNSGQAEIFESFLANHNIQVDVNEAEDAVDLLAKSDLIVFATNSYQPVLPENKLLLYGKTYVGVGSYKPNMKEIPTELFRNLKYCFTDTEFAIRESGDFAEPVANSVFHIDNIHTLGKLILNPDRFPAAHTHLFKGVGNALLDLYAAKYIYNEALEKNYGTAINI